MKKPIPSQKSSTHFDQIPVAIVKKIADEVVSVKDRPGTARVVVEPAARKAEPYSVPSHLLHRSGQ